METGFLSGSQKKVWSFVFDCAAVNWEDGSYDTKLLIKQNSVINYAAIKFFQDTSGYPSGGLLYITLPSYGNLDILNFPLFNVSNPTGLTYFPNKFSISQSMLFTEWSTGGLHPIIYFFPPNPIPEINPQNEFIQVQLSGLSKTALPLSFEYYIETTEFDV